MQKLDKMYLCFDFIFLLFVCGKYTVVEYVVYVMQKRFLNKI